MVLRRPDFRRFRRPSGGRGPAPFRYASRSALVCGVAVALSGCHQVPQGLSTIGHDLFGHTSTVLTGYVGTVVADEAQAALAGQNVLAHGGNAADAASTVAMTLAVTLPSRASIGGGGACIASRPNEAPQSFLFLPKAPPATAASTPDGRPAAIPMTPRGIYVMQLRYGSVEFNETLAPAIDLARRGIIVSRQLSEDVKAVHTALFADEQAQAIFSRGDGKPVQDGDQLRQPELANFLDRLGRMGVGDLYNGALGGIFVQSANLAGAGLTTQDLRGALPVQVPSLRVTQGNETAYFLPPPADGGYGAAAMLRGGSGTGAVAQWRGQHPDSSASEALVAQAQAALDAAQGAGAAASLTPLPASTSFVVTDRKGGAVACALTNDNLFGTGRVAEGMGVVLAASPARTPRPMLGASIVETKGGLAGAAASSGQNDAADALGAATKALMTGSPIPHAGSGRVNAAICHTGSECTGETDPRGSGLATGGAKSS